MRNKFANPDREVHCLALFAKEAEGDEIMLRIAEVDEDIKIVVENPEGSIQYVLDDNNQFQVTEINEDNILNEIVDVLEKSELMKQDLLEQSPKNTDKKQIIERFLHEIEDYNNNFIIEENAHENLAFINDDFDDLCIYLSNYSEPNNKVDKLQTMTELLQNDRIQTNQFKEWDNAKEHQVLSKENRQVPFCNDSIHPNIDGDANEELKKKSKSKRLNTRIWKCTSCNHLARTKTLLIRHKSAEHKVRFICEKCSASFKTKQELKNHNMKHCVVKNVVCLLCRRLFVNNANLSVHVARFHPTWQCAQCSKIFDTGLRLKSHLHFHKIRKYID